MQGGHVRLHCEHVVPICCGDGCSGVGLGVHRIECHHRAVEIKLSQQHSDSGDFISLLVDSHLPEDGTGTVVERGLLKLHAPVAEVIPGFDNLGKEKVNLYHL